MSKGWDAKEVKKMALRKKVENMASSFSLEEARDAWIETQMEVFETDSSVKERWLEDLQPIFVVKKLKEVLFLYTVEAESEEAAVAMVNDSKVEPFGEDHTATIWTKVGVEDD